MTGRATPLFDVRAIGVDHLVDIDRIMARAFDPAFGEAWNKAQCLAALALPGYRLRGAFFDDGQSQKASAKLAGFAIQRTVAGESELLLLAVDPALRRYGIGRTLLRDWINHSRSVGVVRAFLEMRSDNPARHLYQQVGFTEIAVRKAYYRGGDGLFRDAVTMQYEID